MKNHILAAILGVSCAFATVAALTPGEAVARGRNPAVSNQFFLDMQAKAGTCPSQVPSYATGTVHRLSWEQLGCLLQSMAIGNAAGDYVRPLVVEIVTADTNVCSQYKNDPQLGPDVCINQLGASEAAARAMSGVLFVSVDAAQNPQLLSGVDVRVLPAHLLVRSYQDTTHYEAIKIWGFLDRLQLTAAVMDEIAKP